MSYTWHPSYLPQEGDYSDLHAMKHKFSTSETGLIILMQKLASATFMLSLNFHCLKPFTIGLLETDFIFLTNFLLIKYLSSKVPIYSDRVPQK